MSSLSWKQYAGIAAGVLLLISGAIFWKGISRPANQPDQPLGRLKLRK
jgi:hypothetical protein